MASRQDGRKAAKTPQLTLEPARRCRTSAGGCADRGPRRTSVHQAGSSHTFLAVKGYDSRVHRAEIRVQQTIRTSQLLSRRKSLKGWTPEPGGRVQTL